MALEFRSQILACRAMSEGNMIVSYVVEEFDLGLVQQEPGTNGVNRSVAPSLVEESTVFVERFEEVDVRFRSEPLQDCLFRNWTTRRSQLTYRPRSKTRTKWQ